MESLDNVFVAGTVNSTNKRSILLRMRRFMESSEEKGEKGSKGRELSTTTLRIEW